MFFKWADPSNSDSGFAVLPYIKSLTEPLSRLLRNNGIRTTSRPLKTLQVSTTGYLFPPSQDHRLINKQMLFTRFRVPTVRGVILERLEGA